MPLAVQTAAQPADPVYSLFSADPEYRELLELFQVGLPLRRECLNEAFRKGDSAELRILAHQLKGSGGGFGFPELTDLAAVLERACHDRESVRIAAAFEGLTALMDRLAFPA